MANITIVKKPYGGWENCIEVSNGIIDLVATTDVGPRIIRFGFVGKENEFCQVQDQQGATGGDEWRIYGGHRLWHSPEVKPRTYEPDNTPITWKETDNGIVLNQPVEPNTRIRKEIHITMNPDEASVTLRHRLTNEGLWDVELAAWALSVMAPGGTEILPENNRDTEFLPNRMLSLWPYTKLNDHRVTWGEKYILLKQDPACKPAFKIGLPLEAGWAAYANHGHLFVKRFQHIDEVLYPDYSASSYETYTTDFMLEMESLSPLVTMEPGATLEHTETWNLFDHVMVPADEKAVDEKILPLLI